MTDAQDLRARVDQELQSGSAASAREALRELWRSQPSSSTAAYILNCRRKLGSLTGAHRCRLAILRSFTVEPVVPLLQAAALLQGVELDVHIGAFNAYPQELLEPSDPLYAFGPDLVIVCVQTRDLAPQLWDAFPDLSGEETRRIVQNVVERVRSWFVAFRKNSSARLIVHDLERPTTPGQGILDGISPAGQIDTISELNRELRRLAAEFSGIHILDYDGLISRHGREIWHDPMKWAAIRLPIAAPCLQHLAKEWLRYVYAAAGPVRKVLVTDLDNTLWGGLAGEEGLAGVQLNGEYEGFGYLRLQRALLDLYRRGVLLAVCSKNNEPDAVRILEQHPEMILRPEHFAVLKINWNDKAQSLREIAAELNLGVDSLVFLDDNPVERQRIRSELPEVEVIELASDPRTYEPTLRDSVVFDRLALTAEDRLRTQQYREQRGRLELAQAATSLVEFYWSLKQVVTISTVKPETLSRVAQVTQKTNQFNLTTRRYSEKQISDLAAKPGWNVYSVQVEDRFGDNGIVGVVITSTADYVCQIDTFVMSCRVIGRTIESAVLAFIVQECAREGMQEVRGFFLPTKKNAPAASLFPSHGFVQLPSSGEGTCWALELKNARVSPPAWIEMRVAVEKTLSVNATC